MKTFLLQIYTPNGKYFDGYVEELLVATEEYVLGILPNHAPLVAKVIISKLTIITANSRKTYAVSEGLLHVKKEEVTLLVDAIESKDEIDIERARRAKERATSRLANRVNIDIARAEKALIRANNRISVYEDE